MFSKFLNYIIICITICGIVVNCDFCPHECECSKKTNAPKVLSTNFLKVKCGSNGKINDLTEIEFSNISNEIIQLDLSDNFLSSFSLKFQMKSLHILDLSQNRLKFLGHNQFSELSNLRKLDVSQNLITEIDFRAFNNLKKLERLKLNQNRISVLTQGTFEPLSGIKQIDISNNPIQCQCNILWFLEWCQKIGVKLLSNPKCDSPEIYQGTPLRKLKTSLEKQCSETIETTLVQIDPSHSLVGFERDSLMLQCKAPVIIDSESSIITKIEWSFDDQYINSSGKFRIRDQILGSRDLMETSLEIVKLDRNFSGNWSCLYVTPQINYTKSAEIIVISNETLFCPMNTTVDNKGIYTWPLCVAGTVITVICESLNFGLNLTEQLVTHSCSSNGTWINLDTSKCQYVSEQTKILQQFSKITTNIPESSALFKNYTLNLKIFKDFIDVKFTIDTLRNYLKLMPIEEVGINLVDVVNNLFELPKKFYIKTEHHLPGISEELLNVTEKLAGITSPPLFHKSHLALEEFPVSKEEFVGMKCTWYVNVNSKSDRLFYCVTNSQNEPTEMKGKMIEASITIPETIFQRIHTNQTIFRILISMFEDNKLFPVEEKSQNDDVTSAVVGVRIVNHTTIELNSSDEPIMVMLRAPPSTAYEISPYTPVWWNSNLKNWSSDGCNFEYALQDLVIFSCRNFGYYGLLQDVTQVRSIEMAFNFKDEFHTLHPAVYVGSFAILLSHFVAIVTYSFGYETIQIARKSKHSMINLWISVFWVVYFYTFGIHQTGNIVKLCQIIGICIHYFTLSVLLWHCVALNSMYERLRKNVPQCELSDEELPSNEQPIQKPILGLYLVGWGISLIICGLSAAININDYSTSLYCFLKKGPPFSAVYVPFALLTSFICVYTLLVRCAIYSLDANGHLSEGTQATENVDLDLLEPNFDENRSNNGSIRSLSSIKSESDIEDPEHAPITQLRAYIISFVLYVLTWILCALSTNPPFNWFKIFSVSYSIFAILLSSFTLFFHCIARNDVRSLWGDFFKIIRREKHLFRTRNVGDNSIVQVQTVAPPLSQHDMTITSRSSSSRCSSLTKNNVAVELNSSFDTSTCQSNTKNNLNLIALHRQQYRVPGIPNIIENPTNAADVFYNPHQSTVARKFFKRQRKHNMAKRTNLNAVTVVRQNNSEIVDVAATNIFGTNSKVNNTNIHVEYIDKIKKKNLNLYSENENIRRKDNVMTRPYRKKRNNIIQTDNSDSNMDSNMMRSVSQQCTLEYYSSENLSEKILQTEPECSKITNISMNNEASNSSAINSFLKSQQLISRASSSVSASDLDELYQQIRRGPPTSTATRMARYSCTEDRVKLKSSKNPYYSDSEISSYAKYVKYRTPSDNDNLSDNVETTV